VLVADIMMPQMYGYDLYGGARARREGASTPFLFPSAKSECQDVPRERPSGLGTTP
jgi:CheY-like chemotaxis protein